MKVFDIHIGLSDAVIESEKDPLQEHKVDEGLYPNQVDIPRLQKGEVEFFCGMMCPIVVNKTNNNALELPSNNIEELQKHRQIFQQLEDNKAIHIIKNIGDFSHDGIKVILGIEGIYDTKTPDDIDKLSNFIHQGVKVIGPMWNIPGDLLQSSNVTSLDRYFLSFCKQHNLILDLAHSEEKTFYTILDHYEGNVIDSHTNLGSIHPHRRNISNEQIQSIIHKGGIIGMTAVGKFIGNIDLDTLYRHIDTFLSTFGEDHLAIGTDFDGMDYPDLIENFADVSDYPNLITYLEKKNIPSQTIQKIMFDNAHTYFQEHI